MVKNAKEPWDRSKIPTYLSDNWSRTAFLFPQMQASCVETAHKIPPVTCPGWVPLSMKRLGSTSICGGLVPVTTPGEEAQITKLRANKTGALQNQTTGMGLSNQKWTLCCTRRRGFPQKADLTGTRTQTPSALVMVVLLMKIRTIQRLMWYKV